MKVLLKPKYYKVKCNKCLSLIGFRLNEVSSDINNNPVVYCPVCSSSIIVGDNRKYSITLSDNVEPIYEE